MKGKKTEEVVETKVTAKKDSWTVVVDSKPIFTYYLSDTPDAEERAYKVAAKKRGTVI